MYTFWATRVVSDDRASVFLLLPYFQYCLQSYKLYSNYHIHMTNLIADEYILSTFRISVYQICSYYLTHILSPLSKLIIFFRNNHQIWFHDSFLFSDSFEILLTAMKNMVYQLVSPPRNQPLFFCFYNNFVRTGYC